jgi:aminoglycoside phosphotransferase (APT) family kinase protein
LTSLELAREICRKEGLAAHSLQPLSGGQVNAVFAVDDAYVLRIGARENALRRLQVETQLLRSLEGEIPVAKVYAFGEHAGAVYQVQQRLPGEKLYLVWKDLSPSAQEAVAADLAQAMQVLHRRAAPHIGPAGEAPSAAASWADYLAQDFARTLAGYQALGLSIAPGFVELAQDYYDRHIHLLADSVATLTHADLSLVNLLVQDGRLSAILDFEYAVYAPKDYELLVLEAFCLYPNDWAEEEHEHFCSADFATLLPLLQKHYPALFAIPHLRERVNLYHIHSALSSHLAWRRANLATLPPETMAAKGFYMARISNFTFGHGVRMF